MAVSAKNIASALGVSASTISMALRNHPGISDETKTKVLAAAVEMGYTKHLRNTVQAPLFIQLVIYKKHGDVVGDTPFFSQLTQGIEQQTRNRGFNLLVSYFYEMQDPAEQIRSLVSSNCKGIILLATEMCEKDLLHFSTLKTPIVLLDSYFPHRLYDCVGINNLQGAYAATRYLVECGHTELGYLSSKVPIRNFYERLEGYLNGVKTIGKSNKSKHRIIKIAPVADQATEDMNRYLSQAEDLPTAFFADNDIIATSCMRALKASGYRVPDDISIIGFDDTPICDLVDPPLTTMRVQKISLGVQAVNRLLEQINGTANEVIRLEIATELIIRDSVKILHKGKPTGNGL